MSLSRDELGRRIARAKDFNRAEAARVEASGGRFLSIGERAALAEGGYTAAQIDTIASGGDPGAPGGGRNASSTSSAATGNS